MIRINKDSDWYKAIAGGIATVIGFGAWHLVGGFCENMISTSDASTTKKLGMKAGKVGLETIALYSTAPKMKEEIDSLVDGFNELMGLIERYQEEKKESDA